MRKCYMCDAEGVTREHVPPLCFFPKDHRTKLITVPSCPTHNTSNSKDVEYIRNVVVTHIRTNALARKHFKSKALKSFRKSPKLLNQTLKDAQPIIVNNQLTGVGIIDLPRFKLVMKAMAAAIYYKTKKETYSGEWEIFGTSLQSLDKLFHGQSDGSEELRELLQQLALTELPMPQPSVFQCRVQELDGKVLVYEFLFYEGFIVHAFATPYLKHDG
jgi:hypothetical protein